MPCYWRRCADPRKFQLRLDGEDFPQLTGVQENLVKGIRHKGDDIASTLDRLPVFNDRQATERASTNKRSYKIDAEYAYGHP